MADAYLDIVADAPTLVDVVVTMPTTIPPGGSAIIELAPVAPEITAASGFLVVTGTSGTTSTIARRPLTVGAAAPVPRIDKWSGSNQTLTISGAASGLSDLPLTGADCGSLGTDGHEVFITAGSDVASLTYTCQPGTTSPKVDAHLEFNDDAVSQVGQYAGTIKLGQASVAVSYLHADAIGLAILAIAIGILLAIYKQVNDSAIKPAALLDRRITAIGRDALAQQAEFRRRAGAAPYLAYDPLPGVATEIARLQASLGDLRPSWRTWSGWVAVFQGMDSEHLDPLVKEAADLDATVTGWPDLADDLEELEAEIDTVIGAGNVGLAPGLVTASQKLVAPMGDLPTTVAPSLEEIRTLLDHAPKSTKALRMLPVLRSLVDTLLDGRPNPADGIPDRQAWYEARQRTRQAKVAFLAASDVTSLDDAEIDHVLERAKVLLARSTKAPGEAPDASLAGAGGPNLAGPQIFTPLGVIEAFESARRAIASVWSIANTQGIDVIWLGVAVALAVWSGLTLYYIDKPWGRIVDFPILIIWAFGATALLTPIFSALATVFARPTALKTKSDDAPAA